MDLNIKIAYTCFVIFILFERLFQFSFAELGNLFCWVLYHIPLSFMFQTFSKYINVSLSLNLGNELWDFEFHLQPSTRR